MARSLSAGSIVASQAVATAKPDGHTLLLMSNGNAVSLGLFKKLPYDPVKDFEPVGLLSRGGQILIVNNNLPVNSVQDLVKLAKSKPKVFGKVTIGEQGPEATTLKVEVSNPSSRPIDFTLTAGDQVGGVRATRPRGPKATCSSRSTVSRYGAPPLNSTVPKPELLPLLTSAKVIASIHAAVSSGRAASEVDAGSST